MNHNYFLYIFLFVVLFSCKKKSVYVQFETTMGDLVIKLYDETPQHKENFITLVEEGYYDSLLFHRVIDHFMIQAGDPNSKRAKPGEQLGFGGPDYKVPAEIDDSLFHQRGAIGAARGDNPLKESNASQFYIVEGRTWSDNELDRIAEMNSLTYSEHQRKVYKEIGGYAPLDNLYTVFGELVSGFDVLDHISQVSTNSSDRPLEDVRIITAKIIKNHD